MAKSSVSTSSFESDIIFSVWAKVFAVLTVSDHISNPGGMTPEQRETGVDEMTRLVLDALTAD